MEKRSGASPIMVAGVVENRQDPLYLGRLQVRLIGYHTEDKSLLPTEDLPWCHPLLPLNRTSDTVGPKEGDRVLCLLLDGPLAQDIVVLGCLPGIPQDKANPHTGFNDPTTELDPKALPRPPSIAPLSLWQETQDAKVVKPDPKKLPGSNTAYGVLASEYNAADFPFDVNKDGVYNSVDAKLIAYDANGDGQVSSTEDSVVEQSVLPSEPMSAYPLESRLGEPRTARVARGEGAGVKLTDTIIGVKRSDVMSGQEAFHTASGVHTDKDSTEGETLQEPATPYAAKFPYNHASESESGHLSEVDDTPGAERLHEYHRSGTFDEVHPTGVKVTKVVADWWKCVKGKLYQLIAGDWITSVDGATKIYSGKTVTLQSGDSLNVNTDAGNINILVADGAINIKSKDSVTVVSEADIKFKAHGDILFDADGTIATIAQKDIIQSATGAIQNTAVEGITNLTPADWTVNAMNTWNVAIANSANTAANWNVTGANISASRYPLTWAVSTQTAPVPLPKTFTNGVANKPVGQVSSVDPGYILDSPKQGDLWKPISDTKPGAVSLSDSDKIHELYQAIPTGKTEKVTLQWLNADMTVTSWDVVRPVHVKGRLIERSKPAGKLGDRFVFAWKKKGAAYGSNPVIFKTGANEWLLVDPGIRHD